jgi:tRNA threonylcarbamoyladenosine biosynthesis protein TsaB
MKILAFDTTNSTLSVAVTFDGKLQAQENILESNRQAELLVIKIEECLKKAQIWYQDLDLLAFTNGPGSFTGVRVGLSCAKALGICGDFKIIGISSLHAIAYDYLPAQNDVILAVNDARLEEFYIQEFTKNPDGLFLTAKYEPKLIKSAEIEQFLPTKSFTLCGSGKNMIKNLPKNAQIFEKEDFINAKNIAPIGQEIYQKKNEEIDAEALYIRAPKISERKK